jgi:phi13 family phage major tail protein
MARIGFRNVHVAKITKDDETGFECGTPRKLPPAVEGTFNPNFTRTPYRGDDRTVETIVSMGTGEITLSTHELTDEDLAFLHGHEIKPDGVVVRKSTDVPPEVAVLFETTRSNNKSRYMVLYKCVFAPGEQSHATKPEGAPEPQNDSITGSFTERAYDNAWEAHIDAQNPTHDAQIAANWFKSVYGSTTPVATP